MESKIIENREELLEISERKQKLLQSVIDHIEDIKSNPVFMEEIEELREKIKKGEYKIDNQKLASNLLKDSLLEDIS